MYKYLIYMKAKFYIPSILIFLLTGFRGNTQICPLTPDYFNDGYSSMGDTVITDYGNTDMSGSIFYKGDGNDYLCCFAKRQITVKGGKIKEVLIYDANSGNETIMIFDDKGLAKTSSKYNGAYNAPPFH